MRALVIPALIAVAACSASPDSQSPNDPTTTTADEAAPIAGSGSVRVGVEPPAGRTIDIDSVGLPVFAGSVSESAFQEPVSVPAQAEAPGEKLVVLHELAAGEARVMRWEPAALVAASVYAPSLSAYPFRAGPATMPGSYRANGTIRQIAGAPVDILGNFVIYGAENSDRMDLITTDIETIEIDADDFSHAALRIDRLDVTDCAVNDCAAPTDGPTDGAYMATIEMAIEFWGFAP